MLYFKQINVKYTVFHTKLLWNVLQLFAISLTLLQFSALFVQKFWIIFFCRSFCKHILIHWRNPFSEFKRSIICGGLGLGQKRTYPSDHLKVFPPMAQVDGLAVEEPLEDGFQRRVAYNLAGQHNALAHCGVQGQRGHHNPGGFCRGEKERKEKGRKIETEKKRTKVLRRKNPPNKKWEIKKVKREINNKKKCQRKSGRKRKSERKKDGKTKSPRRTDRK